MPTVSLRHRVSATILLMLMLALSMPSPSRAEPSNGTVVTTSGVVASVSNGSITVLRGDQAVTLFSVDKSTRILIDGNASKVADLTPGLIVNVELTGGLTSAIYGRTPSTDAWGKITAINANSVTVANSSDGSRSFKFVATPKVMIYTKPGALDDLKMGMLADVKFKFDDPSTAIGIEVVVPDGGHFHGRIAAITSDSITIESPGKTSTSLKVSATTTVTVDDKATTLAALKIGEFADITAVDGANVTAIAVSTVARPPGGLPQE